MQRIIIIGGTSGIGRELAHLYAGAGHLVGVTGRRQELLHSLQLEYPNHIITESFDVTDEESSLVHLEALIGKLGGLDLLIYNSGWGSPSDPLDWEVEKKTTGINVNGFLRMVVYGFNYFMQQGHGHLVTTSSIASIRGNGRAPSYSASKSFQEYLFRGASYPGEEVGKAGVCHGCAAGFCRYTDGEGGWEVLGAAGWEGGPADGGGYRKEEMEGIHNPEVGIDCLDFQMDPGLDLSSNGVRGDCREWVELFLALSLHN